MKIFKLLSPHIVNVGSYIFKHCPCVVEKCNSISDDIPSKMKMLNAAILYLSKKNVLFPETLLRYPSYFFGDYHKKCRDFFLYLKGSLNDFHAFPM